MKKKDYAYEFKRNEKIVTKYTNLCAVDKITISSKWSNDTPFMCGCVTYSKLWKAKRID